MNAAMFACERAESLAAPPAGNLAFACDNDTQNLARQLGCDIIRDGGKQPWTAAALHDTAAWPVKNVMKKFRPEMEAFIRDHQSRKAVVTPLQEAIAQGIKADLMGTTLPDPTLALPGPDLSTAAGANA